MKNSISVLLTIILFQSCAEKSNTDTTIDLIKKVETGLTTEVYIVGDPTWSIEERMEYYGVPGVSIAVINNGEIEWTKAYGIKDKESKSPVTEQTLFQAVSQPVAAYGVLSLVEQNKVTLNEDINSYLKSWKVPDNEFTKEKKVTVNNLLNHAAGTTVHAFQGYSRDSPIPTLVEVLNGTPPANSHPIVLDKKPEQSHYNSGGGFTVLQQMMIDVEGKKFPEIMNELVLQPLDMNNSTFNQPLTAEQSTMAATGYLQDGSMVKGKSHIYPEMASQGLWTTAEDFAKFVINIRQTLKDKSNKGLSRDMTSLMLTRSPFVEDNYGLGVYIINKKGDIYFGQGLWNRGFYSRIMAHRDKGYGVIVLTNSTHPDFARELVRSVALAYGWDNFVPVHKKIGIEQSLVDKITGSYQSNDKILEVFQKDNLLFTKNILDDKVEELIKVSDNTFVRRNDNRLLQFKPNSENDSVNLLFVNRYDETIASIYAKVDNDKASDPDSLLLEGPYLGQDPPGLIPKLFAPGIVSINGRYEGAISFSPDLEEAYFGANNEGEETAIYFSKLEGNQWSAIKRANFTNGEKVEELHPHVSYDGKRIYFTALDSIFSDEKIWYINRLEDSWSDAKILDSPINDDMVFFPNQPENGDLYYFNLSKGKTYHAPNKDGEFPEVQEVLEFGHHAFISPSQDYLVLTARNKEVEKRRDNDVYVCFKEQDGTWTKPINLGNAVNSDFDEKSPSITPDGKYLFFGRAEREGEIGLSNIHWVSTEVIDQLRPADL